MTLKEAIKHCDEVANTCNNDACALEHLQLKKWLEELQMFRETYGVYIAMRLKNS